MTPLCTLMFPTVTDWLSGRTWLVCAPFPAAHAASGGEREREYGGECAASEAADHGGGISLAGSEDLPAARGPVRPITAPGLAIDYRAVETPTHRVAPQRAPAHPTGGNVAPLTDCIPAFPHGDYAASAMIDAELFSTTVQNWITWASGSRTE